MTTDNKTLADVQPGGMVRLGDQAERARFEAWAHAQSYRGGNIMADRDAVHPDVYADPIAQLTWKRWQAALSAQPSPGGQGDAPEIEQIRTLVSNILSTVSLGHQKGPYAYAGEDFGRYLAEATRDCRTILRALSALAARQPVGEPVAWMTHHDEPMLFPTAAEAADYCEDDEQPVPLFRSPAQALDLGPVRDVFRRWHANELNSTDAMLALVEALAFIDNQADAHG